MADSALMDMASVPEGIEWQAEHAEKGGAPGTARVIRATLKLLDGDTATGRRMANWQGLVVKDAMPLRIAGALHNLVLTGEDQRLANVYAGRMTDQSAVDALVCELVETYDARLLPWLDGPPQTNEAGYTPPPVPKLTIPTLVIWALDDLALPPENLEGLDEVIDPLSIVQVPDCGHFVPWEAPDKVITAMEDFLAANG